MVMGPYRQALADLGVTQLPIQDLTDLLTTLVREHQIYDVLVEAGATLSSVFLQHQLVDEVISYVAPTLLGQSARPMFLGEFEQLQQQQRFTLKQVEQVGSDLRLRLIPHQETV